MDETAIPAFQSWNQFLSAVEVGKDSVGVLLFFEGFLEQESDMNKPNDQHEPDDYRTSTECRQGVTSTLGMPSLDVPPPPERAARKWFSPNPLATCRVIGIYLIRDYEFFPIYAEALGCPVQ
jgi:hypothetical protein